MIPTDITTGHPYVPSWRTGDANPPKYYFRAASVIERSQIEAELSGEFEAGRVFTFEVVTAFRNGLNALLEGDPELDHLLELVASEAEGVVIAGDDRQALVEARAVLVRHWPEYRELIAQQERRKEIAPVLLFRRLCIGWNNVDVDFALGKDKLVPEAVLAKIDPMEMIGAGNFAYGLLYAGNEDRNFPPPSQSDAAPSTSSSDVSRVDGKSKAKGGRKTPASQSQAGSGA